MPVRRHAPTPEQAENAAELRLAHRFESIGSTAKAANQSHTAAQRSSWQPRHPPPQQHMKASRFGSLIIRRQPHTPKNKKQQPSAHLPHERGTIFFYNVRCARLGCTRSPPADEEHGMRQKPATSLLLPPCVHGTRPFFIAHKSTSSAARSPAALAEAPGAAQPAQESGSMVARSVLIAAQLQFTTARAVK